MNFLINISIFILIVASAIPALYFFIFTLAGFAQSKNTKTAVAEPKYSFKIFIPAYKEDAVILDTARNSLQQLYPTELYEVIIIADSLKPQTLAELRGTGCSVIKVNFEKSTKAKALLAALDECNTPKDYAIILDADNIMEKKFLAKINANLNKGIKVAQTHRIAKNTDTPIAILDAISEEINNHIFRKGHYNMGLSAALIGSGMIFSWNLYKHIIPRLEAVGGFDKELEIILLREGIRMHYFNNIYVYDEKSSTVQNLQNQRKRWLSAQFVYLGKNIWPACTNLVLKGNIEYFNKTFQFLLPPRVLHLAWVSLMMVITVIIYLFDHISPLILLTASGVFIITLATLAAASPSSISKRQYWLAIKALPQGIYTIARALFGVRNANKSFIHTQHTVVNSLKTNSQTLKPS